MHRAEYNGGTYIIISLSYNIILEEGIKITSQRIIIQDVSNEESWLRGAITTRSLKQS